MTISTSDIQFFLSGGNNNPSPNASLGGQPSSFPVSGNMNSLFSNVTTEEASAGKTDYRCFYVFNKSELDSLYDVEIFLDEQGGGGSSVMIGLNKSMEIQRINIVGAVAGGGLSMLYGTNAFEALWMGSPAGFAIDLQTKLRAHGAPDASVVGAAQGNSYSFTVSFAGRSSNRSHPLLRVATNNLSGPDSPIVSISKIADGSPINSVAPLLSLETVPPARVSFSNSDESARISVGSLGPGDGFPVWLKRTTEAGTEYSERDYFVFKITGRPF